jgi:CHAT domain-containing protein
MTAARSRSNESAPLSSHVAVGGGIGCIKTLFAKPPLVIPKDPDGTVEDAREKMVNADWVHIACHGIQDPENLLDSGHRLVNHSRLKPSDTIRLSPTRQSCLPLCM